MKTDKPWGYEELLVFEPPYVVKRLFMKAGNRCSMQYHEKKKESIYVLSGKLKLTVGPTQDNLQEKILNPGDTYTIYTGDIHRMSADEDCFYLECSTPELEDVVRLVDDFGRAK